MRTSAKRPAKELQSWESLAAKQGIVSPHLHPRGPKDVARMSSSADKEVAQNLACEKCANGCQCKTQCTCGPTCSCDRCHGRSMDEENECANCSRGSCMCQVPENCNCGAECTCVTCRGAGSRPAPATMQ
ncbi:hypothetical protein COCOBI_06-6850 [Coccomyxa sp. Obi]|nr:hypothetical protein COCOBI_06-6850 [Coccomyxa sp. Obi]